MRVSIWVTAELEKRPYLYRVDPHKFTKFNLFNHFIGSVDTSVYLSDFGLVINVTVTERLKNRMPLATDMFKQLFDFKLFFEHA